jgi:hypothetical protein
VSVNNECMFVVVVAAPSIGEGGKMNENHVFVSVPVAVVEFCRIICVMLCVCAIGFFIVPCRIDSCSAIISTSRPRRDVENDDWH